MKKLLTYNNSAFAIFVLLLTVSCTYFVAAQNDKPNVFEDFDSDGLSNAEEQTLGTDYQNPDTDGDGFGDGVEISSGYDPLKPAPGDRVVMPQEDKTDNSDILEARGGLQANLTEEITSDVYAYIEDEAEAGTDEISTSDFDTRIGGIVDKYVTFDDLPSINVDRVKVKSQDYLDLSKAQKQLQIDDDNKEYLTEVLFLLKKYEPEFAKSKSDAQVTDMLFTEANKYFTTLTDYSAFEQYLDNSVIIKDRLYDVTVPDEMFDIHVKALQLFEFAGDIKNEGAYKNAVDDPFQLIVTLGKAQSLIGLFSEYQADLSVYMERYDLTSIDKKIVL